jgi:UDP-N-acetyl-D-mannosaminuronic acid dehydrogenase
MMNSQMNTEIQTVGIIGLGYVGQPTAAAFLQCGYDVIGIESNSSLVEQLQNNGGFVHEPGVVEQFKLGKSRLTISTDYLLLKRADAIVITVGTPLNDEGTADLKAVESMAELLAPILGNGQLVMLRSTVPPGTTRRVGQAIEAASGLKHGEGFHIAFVPERTIEGIAMQELFSLPSIIGGITPRAAELAEQLLGPFGTQLVRVNTPEIAELCKLADNTYRAVNIAFANEFGLICEAAGADAYEVVAAVGNAYPRTNLFRPGLGADGPCLSKDPNILASFAEAKGINPQLIRSSVKVNIASTRRVSLEVIDFVEKNSRENLKTAVLGMAFKGNPETDDTRNSPAVQVLADLDGMNGKLGDIRCYDPIVKSLNGHTMADSIDDALADANIVLILNDHVSLKGLLVSKMLEDCSDPLLIIDPWHNIIIDTNLPNYVVLKRFGSGK